MMKNLTKLAYISAIALVGAGFAACSSSNEAQPGNVTADGESVFTKFAISLPQPKATRMAAGDAQEDETFSGMKNMVLYPFAVASVADQTTIDFDAINLGALANEAALTESGKEHKSKVYDVAVPIGVKKFLFYASKTATRSGALKATFPEEKGGAVTGINFALVPWQDAEIAAMADDAEGKQVLAALNAVDAALAGEALEGLKTSFEANTAGSAASVAALLEDLSTSLGAMAGEVASTAKATVDAQKDIVATLTFPRNIKLPDGAVSVAYTTTETAGAFAFALNDNKGLGSPALSTITEPAELYYYVESPINVSTTVHKEQYAAQDTWADVLKLYETANGTVTNTTAGIALVNPIQYAVAQLVSSVKLKADAEFVDNKDNKVTPNFEVTGVLVGGQKNVDWQFKPTGTKEYVVYDGTQTGSDVAVTVNGSSANNTLVLETAAETVKVAIEMVNKGDDFFGFEGQLIPSNTRFYLVGELKLTAGEGNATSIFQQDYKTIANFTIGATSLKNAYNTVPDLRTPQLELGLTVDLKWQEGLTFNVEF